MPLLEVLEANSEVPGLRDVSDPLISTNIRYISTGPEAKVRRKVIRASLFQMLGYLPRGKCSGLDLLRGRVSWRK